MSMAEDYDWAIDSDIDEYYRRKYSMATVKGTVTAVDDIQRGKGRKGPWARRRVAVNGEWYGGFLGKDTADAEHVEIGDVVELTTVQNGEYTNYDSLTIIQKAQQAPAAIGSTSAPASSKDNYNMRMAFAGAQKRALQWVQFLIEQDAITLRDASGKAASKKTKEEAFNLLLQDYTNRFYAQNWNVEAPAEVDADPFDDAPVWANDEGDDTFED